MVEHAYNTVDPVEAAGAAETAVNVSFTNLVPMPGARAAPRVHNGGGAVVGRASMVEHANNTVDPVEAAGAAETAVKVSFINLVPMPGARAAPRVHYGGGVV